MASGLDISQNRQMKNYSRQELVRRVIWGFVYWCLFRPSPRLLPGFRNFLLRSMGAKIGSNVHLHPSVRIMYPWNLRIGSWSCAGEGVRLYNLGPMKIGRSVTISQYAHLCGGTHDHTDARMPLVKSEITLGDEVWICADAFIGPGITMGKGSIAAARAVVVKNVKPLEIVAGNPATFRGRRRWKHEEK